MAIRSAQLPHRVLLFTSMCRVATADGLDAELRLCVGNKVDLLDPTPGSRERVYGERVEW